MKEIEAARMKHNRVKAIDDSRDGVDLLRRSLACVDNNIEVRWMAEAEAALSVWENRTPENVDRILRDVEMPEMPGWENLPRLWKTCQLTASPPIPVFSSSTLTNDQEQAQFFRGVAYQKKAGRLPENETHYP